MKTELLQYIRRKKDLIMKDYDTAYDSYKRHESHIFVIRGWTITLSVAYMGFLIAIDGFENNLFLLPAIFSFIVFLLLESIERRTIVLVCKELLKIESLFMIESYEEFTKEMIQYKSRNTRFNEFTKKELICMSFLSMLRLSILLWYLFLIVIFLSIYFSIKFST